MNRNIWMIGLVVLLVPLITVGFTLTKSSSAQERPFRASGPEAVTFEGPDEDVCGAARLKVNVEGTGEATHLGEYQISRRHCFNPGNTPPTFEDGIFEMTAANGDVLTGSYDGELGDVLEVDENGNPIVIVIDAPYVITGGTGRFANAEGAGETEGIFNLQTQEGDFTMEGWIKY